jgi:nucleoside-diphosphate-sugar epimerase
MKKKILITGITGLIGSNTARLLLNTFDELHALVRPGTAQSRLADFQDKVNIVPLDLADIPKMKEFLKDNSFDTIIHIAALRGGRKFSRKTYFDVNVNASEQLMINALKNDSEFVYCSSVGVFGTSPQILPANNKSPQIAENYYYFTKKRCEELIQKYILSGLKAVILRPSITYGQGDFGFPYKLISLIDRGLLFFPKEDITIHLTKVDLISNIIVKLLKTQFKSGSAYIIADLEPVKLFDLVNFISREIKGKEYGNSHRISQSYFKFLMAILKIFRKDDMISSIELISKSWYYDVQSIYDDLNIKPVNTISEFKSVLEWYINSK